MKEIRFLAARGFGKIRTPIAITLMLGCMTVVFLWHEPLGAEDYLDCKLVYLMSAALATIMTMLFIWAELTGSKLLRSMPISPKLFTRGLPLFSVMICTSALLIINIPYIIFCIVSGCDSQNISDLLILSAVMLLWYGSLCGFFCMTRWGFAFMMYSMFIFFPFVFLLDLTPIPTMGFGLPVWAAAAIFITAAPVSFLIGKLLCTAAWRKWEFSPINQTIQSTG